MEGLKKAARVVLNDCMGVKEGETVLIVTDTELKELGGVLFTAARELPVEAVYMEMLPRDNHGVEPPHTVAEAMKHADVVVIPTVKSLSHTAARKEANECGARVATLPGITREIMARTLAADCGDIYQRCMDCAAILSTANSVEIRTPAGTQLALSIAGREACADTGMLHAPGGFGNLPAGEAFVAPVEGTAAGKLVVDGSMAGVGVLEDPIIMQVEGGYVTSVSGGRQARELEALLEKHGRQARNIAELGVGLNNRARLSGSPLEDEKVLGTVHIGLGDNSTFGGTVKVSSHLDGIMLKPTLFIDGRVVIAEGELQL